MGKPELPFEGAWDGNTYYCSPCHGWGAVVYEIPGMHLNVQFFTRKDKPTLKEEYIHSVLRSATGVGPRIGPYVTNITDWLTLVCIIQNFVEEHSVSTD